MEIFNSAKDISIRRPSAVALGFFDGLHAGHIALLSRTVAIASARGLSADVFTFSVSPKNTLTGRRVTLRISTEAEKLRRLSEIGIDRVFNFDFADGFKTMTPEAFAKTLLKDTFAAEVVICGFNFRFGSKAGGDTQMLSDFGKKFGFETCVVEPVDIEGDPVSSSAIRRHIAAGEVETAHRLLGRDFGLGGVVESGRKIGRQIGFPTANIFPNPDMILPPPGVYITETAVDGAVYPSISNIGVAPTVTDDNALRLETHLLDTELTLYGKSIEVFFKKMLRQERRFEDMDALKDQMTNDIEAARHYFSQTIV